MPSSSRKQHNLMEAVKHGFKKPGISKRIAEEFVEADKRAGKFQGKKPKPAK